MDYVCRTILEFGLIDGYEKNILPRAPQHLSLPFKYDLGFLKCVNKVTPDEEKFFPFTLKHLESVIQLWAFASSGLSFVLIAEIVYVRFCPRVQTKLGKALGCRGRQRKDEKRTDHRSIAITAHPRLLVRSAPPVPL